jgi:hypothetical protein
MAATTPNGIPPDLPPADSTTSLGKRKRDDPDIDASSALIKKLNTSSESSQAQQDQLLEQIFDALKRSVTYTPRKYQY